ncbi:MAG TPA: biotin/lipoyl-binding protein [Bryobacteraceae bacterium]|jgi:multidrug resistance efflux pump
MRGKWLLVGGSVIFLSVAAGAFVWWHAPADSQPAPAPKEAKADPKSQAPASGSFFGNEVSLSGILQAKQTVLVAAPIDGTIQDVLADAGTQVFQGQVIAHIHSGKLDTVLEAATAEVEKLKTRIINLDGSLIAARLEASRAQGEAQRAKNELDRTEKAYTRQGLLYKEGATPRLTYEKSERDFKQAQADSESLSAVAKNAADRIDSLNQELDSAKKLLDQKNQDLESANQQVASGEVQAPVDGIVIARKGSPGEQITKAVPDFFQIAVNTAVLEAVVEADPAVQGRIKEGQQAVVRVAEFSDDIRGVVREVKGSTVRIEFASPSPDVKPGLTARVKIKLAGVR